jgi:hypothetical protein
MKNRKNKILNEEGIKNKATEWQKLRGWFGRTDEREITKDLSGLVQDRRRALQDGQVPVEGQQLGVQTTRRTMQEEQRGGRTCANSRSP